MKRQNIYSIGKTAKMFGISVQTLRYYEKIGLVIPERKDENSQYRYYGVKQFEILNTVRSLRQLDIPLEEITNFVLNRDMDKILATLEKQEELIQKKQKDLERLHLQIQSRIKSIEDARNSKLEHIQVKQVSKQKVLILEETLSLHNYLDLEYAIRTLVNSQTGISVYLSKVGVGISKENLNKGIFDTYSNAFLILEPQDIYEESSVILPSTKVVSVRYNGTHTEASKYYKKLLAYIKKNQYTITGFSREVVLIDDGLTNDKNAFVTEINIPIQ